MITLISLLKHASSSPNITTAEEFAIRMMSMDKDVFGSTEFKMIDKRMFHNSTDYSDTANIERFVTLVNTGGEGFTDGTTVNNYQYELCYTIRSWTNTCQSLSGSGTNNNNCGWVKAIPMYV
ncbi:MAG: hypothetical protein IPI54_03795 [Chitinophagaceae bacterium]|nr:hypothetical protein [Chitinophagaceae bacterium]